MVETIAVLFASFFPLLIFVGAVVILIYIIVKRIEDKKNETFEDRNN